MGHDDRQAIRLDDDEGRHLHATWSRSGKRLIVTVGERDAWTQVELRREQAEQLLEFLQDES